jgi:hypothetical protein
MLRPKWKQIFPNDIFNISNEVTFHAGIFKDGLQVFFSLPTAAESEPKYSFFIGTNFLNYPGETIKETIYHTTPSNNFIIIGKSCDTPVVDAIGLYSGRK